MLLASACFFALGLASSVEVTVFDPNRRLAWTPDGKPLSYDAAQPKSIFRGDLLKRMDAKEQDRVVLLRIPWTRDEVPNVVVQFPSGGRREAGTVLLSDSPRKSWVVPIKIPRSAFDHFDGKFEFGVANGPWRTTGTQWPAKKRAKGEAFNVRFARTQKTLSGKKGSKRDWTLTSTLSRSPRHLAWRLLPYGAQSRPMASIGSIQVPNRNAWAYHFEAKDAKCEVTRIDLQRRAFEWIKFGDFSLEPIKK